MTALIYAGIAVAAVIVGFVLANIVNSARGKSAATFEEKLKARESVLKEKENNIQKDAEKEANNLIREAKMTAKEEARKIKDSVDAEVDARRRELSIQEKRIQQKEDNLDKKSDALDGKIKNLEKKEGELEEAKQSLAKKEDELKENIAKEVVELQRIANLSAEEAREILLNKLKGELEQESGIMIRNALDEVKERVERESQELMVNAIQRYAGDCTYERTTATIPLPNDEMKGRIIGREGRNIRALEAATGVSIMIDDTPEAVVISCFDPVRKETARRLMEKLIGDGRIHPTRIEEMVKKINKEVLDECFNVGEQAVLDCGLHGVPKALISKLGTLKFRYSFSQNVLKHSIETAAFMGSIASELGLDAQKARRIGLFHDIGKALDHEIEGPHAIIGADFLRKFNEGKDVLNAVAAHHGDVEATSVYAVLVNACDALSASRPGARSETTELYLKRLTQLESIARGFDGVSECYALQAGRELRVVVVPEKVTEEKAAVMARDICAKIEKEMNYPGQIKISIIRETRAVEYAK